MIFRLNRALICMFASAACCSGSIVPPNRLEAAIVHDELVDGELSGDNTAPTFLDFVVGGDGNTVIGEVANARSSQATTDVFTFNVPDGAFWESLILDDYRDTSAGQSNVSFLGINDSDTFPYDSAGLDEVNNFTPGFPEDAFIGGTLFGGGGAGNPDVGNDLLARSGNAFGAGYVITGLGLPSGDYTIYIQQTDASTGYTLTANLVSPTAIPEPGCAATLMLLTATVAMRRKRK